MYLRILGLIILLSSTDSLARSLLDVGTYRAGIITGPSFLLQDVGERYGTNPSAFLGGQIGHAVSKSLLISTALQKVSHGRLSQTLVPIGVSEYLEVDEGWGRPHFDLGLIFISNELNDVDQTSSGFGLSLGAGIESHIAENWFLDFSFRYVKGFEQSVQVRDLGEVKSLQDSIQIIAGIHYRFGEGLSK